MIRPARARIMVWMACWMHRCAPVKFVRITASQSSCFMRNTRPSRVIAALFTRMSRRPNFSTTCLNPAFICSASATSIFTTSASPPDATISFTSAASFSSLRAATATFAPASDRARAVSRPMPWDAPVTSATLSFKLNIRFNSVAHPFRGEGFSDVSAARLRRGKPSGLKARDSKAAQAEACATKKLGGIRPRTGDFFRRRGKALLVLDVPRGHRALDLAQPSCQYAPRPHFHERVHALIDEQAHGLFPAHRSCNLPDERLASFGAVLDGVRIHIGHQRHPQIRKLGVP